MCASLHPNARTRPRLLRLLLLAAAASLTAAMAQSPANTNTPTSAAESVGRAAQRTPAPGQGQPNPAPAGTDPASGRSGAQGGDSKTSTVNRDGPSPIGPAVPPPDPPSGSTSGATGRPRIGLALGGGGALALSEVGVLQWLEEHHIPVDVIAGTSMGCMVSALYSTGQTIPQLKVVMNDSVFGSVFSFNSSFKTRSFRRREDDRNVPNALTIGLRHGVSLRNSVLTDQGLNAFLDRQFFRYDDRTDFNTLPIPLRCISTDLNTAQAVTFVRGSVPDAIRASVSLPGVYQPFEMNGHEYVDGGVLENLPTKTVREMKADVILAVSLPLTPVGQGELGSILGVLQRSFSVAIEGSERDQRKLADVVVMPDLDGFGQTDYLKTVALAERGYQAAERQKSSLLKYSISDADWSQYLADRSARRRGRAGKILAIRAQGPSASVQRAIERKFEPLVHQPVNTHQIEALLDELRSDGRYDADYTVTYDTAAASSSAAAANASPDAVTDRPTLLVTVIDKKTGPPFLLVGANIEAQSSGVTRATLESIFLYQDLGGVGSELHGNIKLGFLTDLNAEYYRRLHNTGTSGGYFIAPHAGVLRPPYFIYQDQRRVAERQLQHDGGGVDIGWSDSHNQELRLGWEGAAQRWQTEVGSDAQPDLSGSMQRVRLRYVYDSQDRALVPQFGLRSTTEVGYLYNAVASPDAPQITTQFSLAHQVRKNVFILAAEGGTLFSRDVAQPFRFTLGGPLRLSASAIDEYRGTDYFLLEPAFLRRVARLPDPLGQSIYIGAAYEAGQMRAPGTETITRQDLFLGVIAETPLGIITFAPAVGDAGRRKFIFTLGKIF